MADAPPAAVFTRHQAPALLVAAVESVSSEVGRVRLLPHLGLDLCQLLEACAQAVAVLAGARASTDTAATSRRPAGGRLVAAKGFELVRPVRASETVVVEARAGASLAGLTQHQVRAMVAGEVVASGELTVALMPSGAAAAAPDIDL